MPSNGFLFENEPTSVHLHVPSNYFLHCSEFNDYALNFMLLNNNNNKRVFKCVIFLSQCIPDRERLPWLLAGYLQNLILDLFCII